MKKLAMLAALSASLAPAIGQAQLVPGVRVGYALSAGDLSQGVPMSDGLKSQIPLQLDLGWRVLPRLVLGGYAAYGIGKVGSLCSAGADCSGSVVDLGVQATWRFSLDRVSPWAGAGIGYEWGKYVVKVGADELDVRTSGPELLRLMGGVDFVVGEKYAVGPFAQWGLGRYAALDATSPVGNSSGAIPDRAVHSWFTIGVRGTFEPIGDGDAAARRAETDRAAIGKAAAQAKAQSERLAAEKAAAAKVEAERLATEKAAAAKAQAERLAAEQAAKADRDDDGIPDAQDACPDEKGEPNADPKRNGCKALVGGTQDAIELVQSVRVRFETGKAVIQPESDPVLGEVAGVLDAHPKIAKIRIEGYTDNAGRAAANTALSQRRAEAVKVWLVEKGGIAAARLEAKGFGPAKPIADNGTTEGRARNRRVEFKVLK
jgi:outer membrane protein OmpA-like peptidoglycan-associated protein